MKKLAVLGLGVCILFAFSSCKSSESAYKKAYEKAKQQELAEPQNTVPAEEVSPAISAPTEVKVVESAPAEVRQEKVTVVTGSQDGLKDYSVVCGSFGVKANAESLKGFLDKEGYNAIVVFNAEKAMYRVVVSTFATRAEAENARDAFKARYPGRSDFQGSWLLYRL
ncbi:SPOR domain-containing protein [uncultured Bacteroides sp.]|uniref:SPOR domain-containing protein n=1 Tax=uncultured Bacteroides sp. TaxID=162156 RepID=UPI002617EF9C|nr:SPOR domain-containing protein [uncultured Bacteroides sp.]